MQLRTANFIEDVEWLVTTGETHAEAVARRLGKSPQVVERRLQRHGRGDLVRRITGSYCNCVRRSGTHAADCAATTGLSDD